MGGANVKFLGVIILFPLVGLFVLQEVILARTSIGQFYLYIAIAALILGLVSPKKAMYAIGFCTIYIDFFKRLMVIGGNPSMLEVSYVLAIPPMLMAGSLVSIVLSLLFSRVKIAKDVYLSFILASVVAVGSMAGMIAGDASSGLGGVGQMVNQGFYAYLVFIVPVIFPSDEERRKYLNYFFILLIPSVMYMFFQEYNGYADFEYDYLMSGLSIEMKNLSESGYGELRKFSTFNGSGTASTIYSIFLVMCFISFRKDNQKATPIQKLGKLLLAPCFILASYYTISRTGWFCGMGTLAAYVLLGSRFRSMLGIVSAVTGFGFILAVAPTALKENWLVTIEGELKHAVKQVSDDPALQRSIVLGTFGDRLQGWANLTQEPKIYTPFGFAAAGIDVAKNHGDGFKWGHDALIDSLIKFGYIPISIALVLGAFFTYRLFNYIYSLHKKSITFKVTRLSLALAAGILFGGMSSGAQFRNFPQNFYFMLFVSIVYATYQQAQRERKQSIASSATPYIPNNSVGFPESAYPVGMARN